ncbi:MAG TPA: sulfatase-like hydrolase/transferase, partial [Opitutaceae bacterium]|nr:sulfatase-like hydrolase/transferase [Opitutaceae bacterium]
HTGFFGKWHLSPRDPHAPLVGDVHARSLVSPEYRGGFTYWEGFESGFLLNDPWIHGSLDPHPRQHFGYQSEILVDRFLNWHDSTTLAGRQPWFAVVSLEAPHPPYLAPA